jgi:hypothetical protein
MPDTLLSIITEYGNSLGVDTAAPFKHDEVWKTVTARDGLFVRGAPGGNRIGYLRFDEYVRVDEISGTGWAHITSEDGLTIGWVSEAYLK